MAYELFKQNARKHNIIGQTDPNEDIFVAEIQAGAMKKIEKVYYNNFGLYLEQKKLEFIQLSVVAIILQTLTGKETRIELVYLGNDVNEGIDAWITIGRHRVAVDITRNGSVTDKRSKHCNIHEKNQIEKDKYGIGKSGGLSPKIPKIIIGLPSGVTEIAQEIYESTQSIHEVLKMVSDFTLRILETEYEKISISWVNKGGEKWVHRIIGKS